MIATVQKSEKSKLRRYTYEMDTKIWSHKCGKVKHELRITSQ